MMAMARRRPLLTGFAALFLLFTALGSFVIVPETKQAVIVRFGMPIRILGANQAGINWRLPFAENVQWIDKRVLDVDMDRQQVLSTDQLRLEVDAFARYRIRDALRFYQSVNNVALANQRLVSFVNSAMRNVLASASRDAIVRTDRLNLMNRIQEDVNRQAQNLGVEIIDLRLTRVDLPAANSQAVYQRMQTERQREAADLRANGAQQAQTIRARAEREATIIVAEANRRSEELRGQGDADKNRILAEAFGRDADFFTFFRSMQAYEAGLKPGDTRMVLSPTSDFFRYFNDPMGRSQGNTPGRPPGASAPGGAGSPAPGAPAPAPVAR
jgi:modulator of FtsH protease HflC